MVSKNNELYIARFLNDLVKLSACSCCLIVVLYECCVLLYKQSVLQQRIISCNKSVYISDNEVVDSPCSSHFSISTLSCKLYAYLIYM